MHGLVTDPIGHLKRKTIEQAEPLNAMYYFP